jgi:hypothetical protein
MIDVTLPGYYDVAAVSFSNAWGTNAKVLVDVSPSQIVTLLSSETAFPGETTVRQQILRGGSRVIDGLISSTDTASKVLAIYIGQQLSVYSGSTAGQYLTAYTAMGTVTTTATTNSTITRTTGSFITEGWQIGDLAMCFGAVSAANNGTVNVVTAVTGTTLTVSGTTGISVAETQGAGFRVIRVSNSTARSVATLSGTDGSTAAVPLIGGTLDPRVDNNPYGIMLGQRGMLIVAPTTAVTATKKIDVSAHFALY